MFPKKIKILVGLAIILTVLLGATPAFAAYTLVLNEPTVSTSEPPYATVLASGSVQADGQPVGGIPVALLLSGDAGQLLAADQVPTNSQGVFSTYLALPTGTRSGSATLVAAAAGSTEQKTVDIPPLPAAYYGSVKDAKGQSVASGKVEAYVEGHKAGEMGFTNGLYGGPGGLDPKLVVSGTQADRGKPVTFKVVIGTQTLEATVNPTVAWQPGDVRRVDLTVAQVQQPPQDTTPPTVTSTDPTNNATGVPRSKTITVTFSEEVQEGLAYGSISVKDAAGNAVAVTNSIGGKILSIKPNASLAYSTKYTVTVPAGAVKDASGNALAQEYAFSFTTQAAPISGGGEGPGGGVTTPAAEKVEKPVQAGAATVAEISGKVRVEVPAGAVSGVNAAIVAEVVGDEKASGAGMPLLSKVVDITLKNGTLTGEITITLYFDKGKLGENQEPAAFYYDEKAGKWARLEGIVNLDKGTVTVTVDHLTLFAVFAVAKQAEQPQPPVAPPTKTFGDIQGHWAQKDIEVMAGLGIAGGVAPDKFDPNGLVTRAQFAAFLIRSLGIAETKPAAGSFKDVSPDAWYYGAVETARASGLVGGYPDGTFRPNQNITREEIAAMVVRGLAKGGKPVTVADPEAVLARFADKASIGPWAREAAAKAAEAGIVGGREGNRFAPKENATRAEAVVMLKRMLVSLGRIPE